MADQKIIIYGSGSAGLGIARQLHEAIKLSDTSLSDEEVGKRFYLIDKNGLLKQSLGTDKIRDGIESYFVRSEDDWGSDETNLLDVIKKVKPTVMIGTSTHPRAFNEDVVKEMAKHVDRPIIFPVGRSVVVEGAPAGNQRSNQVLADPCLQLSNPTRLCEVQ